MKNSFTFLIRLSIINFFLYMLAVVIIGKFDGKPVKREGPRARSDSPVSTQSVATPMPTGNLLLQLQNHNKKSDCWISYSGHIYNMTSYIGFHPGGDDYIIRYCGKDATEIFNRNHSEDSRVLLQQYLLQ